MAILIGLWDCPQCGTKGIQGDVRNCPHCGAPRDKTVKFYLGNSPRELTPAEESAFNKNPDWVCPFCGALNNDSRTSCEGCGSPKTDTTYHDIHPEEKNAIHQKDETEATPSTHSATHCDEDTFINSPDPPFTHSDSYTIQSRYNKGQTISHSWTPPRHINWKKILLIAACVIAVAALIWLIWPKQQRGVITAMRWEYTINYEEYREVTETGWSIPAGGTEVSHRQAIRYYQDVFDHTEQETYTWTETVYSHTEQRLVGYRDMGNGSFEEIYAPHDVYNTVTHVDTRPKAVYRQEPVYDTKYTYTIWRWVDAPEYRLTSAGDTKETRWPATRNQNGIRETTRNETYYITVTGKSGKENEYIIDKEDWFALSEDLSIQYKIIFHKLQLINE